MLVPWFRVVPKASTFLGSSPDSTHLTVPRLARGSQGWTLGWRRFGFSVNICKIIASLAISMNLIYLILQVCCSVFVFLWQDHGRPLKSVPFVRACFAIVSSAHVGMLNVLDQTMPGTKSTVPRAGHQIVGRTFII